MFANRRQQPESSEKRTQDRAADVDGVGSARAIGGTTRPIVDQLRRDEPQQCAKRGDSEERANRAMEEIFARRVSQHAEQPRIGGDQRQQRSHGENDPDTGLTRFAAGDGAPVNPGSGEGRGEIDRQNHGERVDHVAEIHGE